MGTRRAVLPENILKRMSPADRAPLGKAGVTIAEAQVVKDKRAEKELQRDMANLLKQRGIFFVQSRLDKKTTLPVGYPDFVILLRPHLVGDEPRALAVEAKVDGGAVSKEQEDVFQRYWEQTWNQVVVVWSLDEFRRLLDRLTRQV